MSFFSWNINVTDTSKYSEKGFCLLDVSIGVLFCITLVGHRFGRYTVAFTDSAKNLFGNPFSCSVDLVISVIVMKLHFVLERSLLSADA